MADRNKNPFVVEIEEEGREQKEGHDSPSHKASSFAKATADKSDERSKPQEVVKMVIEPTSSTFVSTPSSKAKEPDTGDKEQVVPKVVTKPVEEATPPPPKKSVRPTPSTTSTEKPVGKPEPQANRTKIQWGTFFAGVGVTLLITGITGGLWWAKNSQRASEMAVIASPTPQPIVEATPEPTPLVWTRDSITVEVLNASGVTGKAGQVADQIEELGYVKGTTGNTAGQTGSTVSFSEDVATLSAVIMEDLKIVVPDLTGDDTVLQSSGKIQVTIGE